METPVYAIDFETSYTKERDITSLGVRNYLQHPETDIYLVSIVGSDGMEWVGDPCDFNWDQISDTAIWVSHNAHFDIECYFELHSTDLFEILKEMPLPKEWHCTADLSVFLGAPRNLKGAAKELLGVGVDKSQRDFMKGKKWEDLSPEEKQELMAYALNDARYCLQLWQKYSHEWPESERHYSQHTRMMRSRGIGVNSQGLEAGLKTLETELFKVSQKIPWFGELDEKRKEIPPTSPKMIIKYCAKENIPAPESTDSKNEIFDNWLKEYADKAPFVQAVGDYRKINRLMTVLENMKKFSSDDRLCYGLKYFGAHTGRWSGDAGLNMQNMPRESLFGIDARSYLVPEEEHKFVVADYSQIEARILCWFAQQWSMLELIESGMDIYEAHARATMGYSDPRPMKEVEPKLRHLAKARVLGLGYGCGAAKFRIVAKALAKLDLSEEECKRTVNDYRRANPEIVLLWNELDTEFKRSLNSDFSMTLPSGRKLIYRNVTATPEYSAQVQRGEFHKRLYGGLLTENLVQATARDLLAEAIIKLENAGYPVVLHVHDEVVCEVPENTLIDDVKKVMLDLPEWTKNLPVSVDIQEMECYGK